MGLIQNKVTVSQPNSHVVVKNAGGLRGLTGETGPQGPQGVPGEAATVTAGTTTTLPAGSDATVQNVGSTSAAIFNFGIPKGDKGDTGETGTAATISVGSTSTLPAGSSATVTNSGTSSAAVFDFGIPKGDKGDTGATGADGYSPSATVTKTGDTATITITDKDGTTTASISDGSTPTVNDGTLTIQKNGTTVQTFSADQASNVTANITVPTQFSDLSGTVSSSQIEDEAITTGSVSGTGTNITLAGTMEGGAIESVEMYGDTEQQTYSGKNLLNQPSSWSFSRITNFQPLTAGTYYVSCGSVTKGGENDPCIGSSNSYVTITSNMLNKVLNFAGTDLTVYSNGWSWGASSVTSTVENLIITTSPISSLADYEPYVGGTASPNPDYPQEVQTVTGEQTVMVVGKNRINVEDGTGTRGNNTVVASGQTVTADTSGGSGTESAWYLNDCSIIQQYAASYSTARDYHLTTEGGTYTVTVYYENMPSGTATLHCYVYTNKQAKILNRNMVVDNKIVWTVTLEADEYIKSAMIYTAAANVFSNFKTRIQIEKGTIATSYQPYQSGSYPINLGKNLLPFTNQNFTKNNITFSVTDGTLYLDGTSTGETGSADAIWKTNFSFTLPAGTYTFSLNTYTMASYIKKTSDNSNLAVVNGTTLKTATFTITEQTEVYLGFYMYNLSFSNLETTYQLERGSTATTYAPYFTPIELCKIGTYQDYIYKSGEDWYIHKEIGNYVLEAAKVQSSYYYRYRYAKTDIPNSNIPNGSLDMKLQYFNAVASDVGGIGTVYAGGTMLNFRYDQLGDDIDGFKTWITNTKPSVYYPLFTPTDTQITDATLIAQLEDLLSATTYAGTTYITVSGDLASPLEVVAEADSKLAPDSVYGAAIKDGAVSVDKIADLQALADALSPYLN